MGNTGGAANKDFDLRKSNVIQSIVKNFRTDQTENVFPMVQAGKGITEMLLGSEDL